MIEFLTTSGMRFGLALIIGSTLVMVCAFLVQACCRKLSAAERFSVWQIAIVGLLLLPLCCLLLPQVKLGLFSSALGQPRSAESIRVDSVFPDLPSSPLSTAVQESSRFPSHSLADPKQADPKQALPGTKPSGMSTNQEVHENVSRNEIATDSSLAVERETAVPATANRQGLSIRVENGSVQSSVSVLISVTSDWIKRNTTVLFCVWWVVAFFLLARVVWSCLWANAIRKNARPFPALQYSEIEKSEVPILVSDQILVPVTVGVCNPAILVPADSLEMELSQLRMVLKHELAHVERRDVLWQLISVTAKSLFWFQPLVWIAEERMKLQRERACDDRVVGSNESPQVYATTLLQIAAKCSGLKMEFAGALSMAQKPIESRLLTILEPATRRRRSSWMFNVGLCAVFTAAVLAVSIIRPFASPALASGPLELNVAEVAAVQEPATAESAGKKSSPQTQQEKPVEMIELPAEITGKIVDQKGVPIPNATAEVELLPYSEWNIPGQDKKHELPPATTDENGVFTLKTKGIKVPKTGFKISGDFSSPIHPKRGMGLSVRKFVEAIENDKPIEIGNFGLIPGRIVKGRVIAPESGGMALPDPIRPFVQAARGMPSFWWSEIQPCDESGNFEILIPKSGLVELRVGSQNYASVRITVSKQENDLGEIRLFEGTEVVGTLVGLDGNPVEGAIVNIVELGEEKQTQLEAMSFEIESSAQTNSEGKFRLPPHRGECQVSVVRAGRRHGSMEALKSDSIKVFEQEKLTLDVGKRRQSIQLQESPTTWVRGTFRWPDGRPCQNVQVRSLNGFFTTHSDKDGKYSIRVLKDANEHSLSAFGAKAEDGTFHYAKASGEEFNQFASLEGTGEDITLDWTLVSHTRTSYLNAGEAGQALDEICLRLNKDRKTFFKKVTDGGVGMISDEIRFGEGSPYQKYPDELLEFEKEYRGEFSALVALKRILEWSDNGLESAQKNRREVLNRIRDHYLEHKEIGILLKQFSGSPMARHRPHVPRVEDQRDDEREIYEQVRKTNPHDKVQAKILYQDVSGMAEVITLIDSLERKKWKIPPISTRDELLALRKLDVAQLRKDLNESLAKLKSKYPAVLRYTLPHSRFAMPTEDVFLRMHRIDSHGPNEFMTYAAAAEAIVRDTFQLLPGKKVPEIVGKDAYGKPFKLSDLKGKAIVLYFASIRSKGFFVQHYDTSRDLRKQFKGKLEIVTIMVDEKSEPIQAAIEAGDITWRAIHDGKKGPIARAWNIDGLDREAFLIDKNGVIVSRVGQNADLKAAVEKMMKGTSY